MSTQLKAAITNDIDTLSSIYKGKGCRRTGGYDYSELRMGLKTFSNFLTPYGIKATLFMVGNDFLHKKNHDAICSIVENGHEIANHTMTHDQGFRFLSPEIKGNEITRMEQICIEVTGHRPKGFRSPGWNISDDTLSILKKGGYFYDSSIFPTLLMPLFKLLHWSFTRSLKGRARTTLGLMKYMTSPIVPYRINQNSLSKRGSENFVEFPITVIPFFRLPFFATFLLATGLKTFKLFYHILKSFKHPILFQFHLSDFVDYSHPDLVDQTPSKNQGVYVPQALMTPLADKLKIFHAAIEMISKDYYFTTLHNWASQIIWSMPK